MSNQHRVELYQSDDGQLSVYKRLDKSGKVKPTWYYDIIIPKQKRIRFKSTQFTDFGNALMYAKTQYQKMLTRVNAGISLNDIKLDSVCREAIEYYKGRVELGFYTQERLNRMVNCVNYIFIPYFTKQLGKDFHEITALDVENMIAWRKRKGSINNNRTSNDNLWIEDKIPSNGTINKELSCLRQIYEYASKREIILTGQIPKIPNIKHSIRQHRREHFTMDEWRKITTYLQKYAPWQIKNLPSINLFEKKETEYNKLLQRHFWLMLSQSCCRVGELREIKWNDIEIRPFDSRSGQKIKRLVLKVNGKTGKRSVVCMPRALETMERWKQVCEYYKVTTNKDDYVWRHPWFSSKTNVIDTPVSDTYNAFKKILSHLELLEYGEEDHNGNPKVRTLYSIRHSAISWMLTRNVPIEAISKNVGSSIETLQRVYDHTVSTDYMESITQNDPTHMDKLTVYEN